MPIFSYSHSFVLPKKEFLMLMSYSSAQTFISTSVVYGMTPQSLYQPKNTYSFKNIEDEINDV